jgi:hypothetical protein
LFVFMPWIGDISFPWTLFSLFLLVLGRIIPRNNIYPTKFFPGYTLQWLVFNFLIAIKYSPIRWLIKSEPNRYLSFGSTKLKKLLYYFKQHPNWTDIRWLIQSEPNRYLSFRSIKLKKLIYYFKQYSNWTNNWVSY